MKESATKSAMMPFVRFAELAPLAMAPLGCCAQPVTDTCRAASCETESKGVSTSGDGHDCSDYKADNGNSYMNGVLGICHNYSLLVLRDFVSELQPCRCFDLCVPFSQVMIDNGPEFIVETLRDWCKEQNIRAI